MNALSRVLRIVRPILGRHQNIRRSLVALDDRAAIARHALAQRLPWIIRPSPRQITIAITAACNLRCQGCRYGRDFMVGEHLALPTVLQVLEDARDAGVATARFYGGEPMLHKDLPQMIERTVALGMRPYITSNGTLLEQRIEELYAAGLRTMTIGFYGVGDAYDGYTQRAGHFEKLRRGIEAVRRHCGSSFEIQINFMLSRHSCSMDSLQAAWAFAREYDLFMGVDPVSKTIPFFQDPSGTLDLTEVHRVELERVTAELVRLKREFPHRIPPSLPFLRALPDLLLKDAAKDIPCDAYELLWVGADGSLQLCDVAFPLGNVKTTRLRELLFTETHCAAARDGFALKCPSCMCKIDSRIRRNGAVRAKYSGP